MARPFIVTAEMAHRYARTHLFAEKYDVTDGANTWIILLNGRDEIKGCFIADDGIGDCIGITRAALALEAKSVIVATWHTWGECTPTQSEMMHIGSIKKALYSFDIHLTDCVILTDTSYFSFAEEKEVKR